jgi:predicted metalloprotease with PDZ domain
VTVSYRLACDQRSVTTNWVSPQLGVLNGAATFVTLADRKPRPHEVRLVLPAAWKGVATALPRAGEPHHYRASDFDALVDSPIVAGDLDVRGFRVGSSRHELVDVGERTAWDGARATRGAKSLDDAMRLAYERYSGARGFTAAEFEAVAARIAGTRLAAWFDDALRSTNELDYGEALDWYGLRFASGNGIAPWTLETRPQQTPDEARRLRALLEAQ